MVAYQGTLSAVATTTVAATTIRTQMQTTIPSHSAWSLVESTTTAQGYPCDVYKCAAAGSGRSADFYVGVFQNAGTLYLGIAEGYNTSTHKPKRPALLTSTALQTLQADGGIMPATTEADWGNGTYNPGAGSLGVATVNNNPAVTDDYLIVVAKDVILLVVRTTAAVAYAGAYDSLVPTPATNDPLPLALARSATIGASTRHPMGGGQSIGYAGGLMASNNVQNPLTGALLSSFNLGTLNAAAADNFDRYVGGPSADKYAVQNSYIVASSTTGRDKNGWLRGSWRLLRGLAVTAGTVWGDTCTIDGVTYFAVAPSTNQFSSLWVEADPA